MEVAHPLVSGQILLSTKRNNLSLQLLVYVLLSRIKFRHLQQKSIFLRGPFIVVCLAEVHYHNVKLFYL